MPHHASWPGGWPHIRTCGYRHRGFAEGIEPSTERILSSEEFVNQNGTQGSCQPVPEVLEFPWTDTGNFCFPRESTAVAGFTEGLERGNPCLFHLLL